MKILLIGASGFVGSALLQEALDRGHAVTAMVRDAARLHAAPGLAALAADATDADTVARAARDQDAVLSAFSPGHGLPDLYQRHLDGSRAIIEGVRRAGRRLLVVGGAGSLEVAPGLQLVDAPDFPAQWKQTALATREVLRLLREQAGLDWTMLSPPPLLEPGPRTGRYRVGADAVLPGEGGGKSRISLADYAAAMLDETEWPRHAGRRFTVAA